MPFHHFKVDKLVRDPMPAILREQNIVADERIIEQKEFI